MQLVKNLNLRQREMMPKEATIRIKDEMRVHYAGGREGNKILDLTSNTIKKKNYKDLKFSLNLH